MKKIVTKNLIYTQKNIIVGNKKRNVIVIDKNSNKESTTSMAKPKSSKVTVRKKRCGGCSRNRRG